MTTAATLAAVLVATAASPVATTFPSTDGLEITADLYRAAPETAPLVVLFHQAGWSRGEYREIAPRLGALGLNCLAVDQRSGDAVNDVPNATAARALAAKKGRRYIDALGDIEAALAHARTLFPKAKVIAWGSSYSAALVLRVAGEHPELVDGVLAFSPGEYFESAGKPATWIREAAAKIRVPVFITSARNEQHQWAALFAAIPSADKVSYVAPTAGNHGSRALWRRFDDSPGYWTAVETFMRRYFLS